jgi:hypothetical protein
MTECADVAILAVGCVGDGGGNGDDCFSVRDIKKMHS